MRRAIPLLILFISLLLSTQISAAMKIGFVNTERLLTEAPQVEAGTEKLKREFAPRDARLVADQKRLKGLEEKFQRNADIMSDSERRRMERSILSLQRDIKRSQEEFTEDFNIRRNEEFAELRRIVAKAIVDLAKERRYDLIFESGVVYADDDVDITDEVMRRLQRMR